MDNIVANWLEKNKTDFTKLKNHFYNRLKTGDIVSDLCKTNMVYINCILTRCKDYEIIEPKIVIKKSNIHNNGVFADKVVGRGEFITFYPCHYIKIVIGDKYALMGYIKNEIDDMENFNNNIMNRYSLTARDEQKIIWIGDPDVYDDLLQVGHIVNHSKYKSNAVFYKYNNIWTIEAIKKIKKGEEILIDYGESYWSAKRVHEI
jgi:SET domain-containing protein